MWRLLSPVVMDRFAPYHIPDSGSPGGGGEGGSGRDDDDDLTIIGKGDATTLALQLDRAKRAKRDADNEAKNLRERLRAAETKLAGFEGEGVTVLRGDEAAAYREYATLGKPAEIKTKLAQTDTLAAELGTLKRDATLRQVAEVAGYKPAVLTRLGGDREYAIKDETVDGKAVKRAYIKTEQGEQPLTEYAASEWADFLPALSAGTDAAQRDQQNGVRYPIQGSGQPPTDAERLALVRQEQERSGRYSPF